MTPPSKKGGRELSRSPKSQFRLWGSSPTRPADHPAGSLSPPQPEPHTPPAPATQNTGRVHRLRTGLAPKPHIRRCSPHYLLPQRKSWSPGLAAKPGPRPHSPTGAQEARPPLLDGAHPKPPTAKAARSLGKKKEKKKKKEEERK